MQVKWTRKNLKLEESGWTLRIQSYHFCSIVEHFTKCMLASARSSDLLYSTVQITNTLHCHTFQAPNCATTVDSVDFKFRVGLSTQTLAPTIHVHITYLYLFFPDSHFIDLGRHVTWWALSTPHTIVAIGSVQIGIYLIQLAIANRVHCHFKFQACSSDATWKVTEGQHKYIFFSLSEHSPSEVC